MNRSIDLVDERDMYLYSFMHEAYGSDITVDFEDKGSFSGIPTDIIIQIENPNIVGRNPARTPLKSNATYQIIIIEKDIERK